ncbi:Ferritin-like protein 2 [Klebsiella pneumoniae]|uniref:Ferritin-like protein 2 n=1 Tax=Klebsiella pneumoniae TaxID=573 RepID=A0A377VYY8_KLEPN|nr:Ferritin-like protein 2 [Klebsiella pneumoniae]
MTAPGGFLTLLAEEQQQDGLLLQSVLEEFVMPIKPVSGWSRPIGV